MSRNEDMYPNADKFHPERFLTPNKSGNLPEDPASFVFGFGRRCGRTCFKSTQLLNVCYRICPGINFADASLFIIIASILATFNISKALDEQGNEITPPVEYANALITYVLLVTRL
jgi:cytochrome P450